MENMIPAIYYGKVFLYVVIFMTFIVANKWANKDGEQIIEGTDSTPIALFVTIVFAYWVGQRPLHSIFGDSYYYAHTYHLMQMAGELINKESPDWLWDNIALMCSQVMDVHAYFTIVAIGYFGLTFVACVLMMRNNVLVALLFVFGSFSFFSYGTNGLRNGLACSLVLVIIALALKGKKNIFPVILLSLIAAAIHKSTTLPIGCLLISMYLIRSFKQAYIFWIASILISLVAGNSIIAFFAGLGFDERLSYMTSMDAGKFSSIGFRWDFLLYSMMPIILGYYVIIKRGIKDQKYELLLNTYTLANAFWVMVIRANYSNRFAYLSWFMYPVVLAYPLLKLDIWEEEQGKYLRYIMLAQVGFTWLI